MKIPLSGDVAGEIELRLAKFSRGWTTLDPLRQAIAFKVLVLCEMLGGRTKAAEAVELADNTLDNYRHGKKDPTFAKLEMMAEKAGIAPRYLSGDWYFEKDSIRIDLSEPAPSYALTNPPGLMDNPPQPYLHGHDDIAPASGTAALIGGYWSRLGFDPKNLSTLLAEGDSMAPTITDRAPVFIDRADRDLVDGGVYALRADGKLLIRRIQRLVGGGLQLIADNAGAYPAQQVGAAEIPAIDVIGRVRSVATAC